VKLKASIELMCPKCLRAFRVEVEHETGYGKVATRCPHCNTIHHVTVSITARAMDVTEADLEEFEEWLIRERGILSAREYRRQVEKYLETGEIPPRIAALNQFKEFMKTKKGRELPIF